MAYQGPPPQGYPGGPPPGHPGGPPPGHMGGPPPPGHPGGPPPPGHMGGPPPGHMGGPPPGHMGGPPPGHMGGPPPGHPGGPPPGHPGGPPPGHMGGPPPGHPGGPPPGHPGGPPPGHPGGPPPGHMGGPPPGAMPGAPPPEQPWSPGQGGPHQWDNMPQQPVIDNPNAAPPAPPPPNMGGFQSFQGYERVGAFGQVAPMPPPPPPPPPQGQPPPMDFGNTADLDEQACRDAMLQFVSENCCYGKAPAQEMQITKISPSNALHYILETYCEARSTGYVHEPFRGQPIDGPENGMPPPPWQIPCQPDQMFVGHQKKLEVPHTAQVKMCHGCDGRGFNRCHRCMGRGQVRCHSCGGDGVRMRHDPEHGQIQEPCFNCHGDGLARCTTCGGDGRITCSTCQGHRRLKCFIQLTVTFTNHSEDFILEGTDMPDELVRDVGGTVIFEQVMLQVWPIIAYPVKQINDNSVRLVEKHRGAFPNERRLNQRQQLRSVPVTEVDYKWNDVSTRFWVYGQERKVHAPDYPQQCCWGCQIL